MSNTLINYLYWLAMVLLLLYFAYIRGWIFVNFESHDAQTVEKMLLNDENITLLDIRSSLEFEREHIANAHLIPLFIVETRLSLLAPHKNKKIIIYCHSGSRSIKAARILETNGFTPINLKGGLIEWKKEGLPLTVGH